MNLLTVTIFPNNEQETRIARAFHSLLVGVSVAQVLLLILNLILAERRLAGSALIVCAILINLLAWGIMRGGRLRLACALYLSIQWLIIAILVLLSNGPVTITSSLFIAISVIAMQFLGKRVSVFFAALSLTYTFALISAPSFGITITQYFPLPPLLSWFLLVYGVVVTLIPVISINNSLNESLNTTRNELKMREQAEESLQESEQRFRKIFNLTPAAFAISDNDGKYVEMNPAALAMIGRQSKTEVLGRTPFELGLVGDNAEQRSLSVLLNLENGGLRNQELELISADGSARTVLLSATTIELSGEPHILSIGLDITERKQIETALRASEDRYRIISEMIIGYAFASVVDKDGKFEQDWITEESYTRLTGYTWQEIGSTFKQYHPDDEQKASDDVAAVLRGQETTGEYRVITKDGRLLWLRVRRKPIWSEAENRVIRYFGAAEDITERKQAEMALQRSEALLRALLDATTDVAFLTTADGTVLTANKTLIDAMKIDMDTLVGKVAFDLLPPDVSASRRTYFNAAIQSHEPVRWEDLAASGWWDNSIYPVLSATGVVEAFAVYSRNITERKRLEAELHRYTEHLEQMVEERSSELNRRKAQIESILYNTSDALALSGPNGDFQRLNPAFIAMFDQNVISVIEDILRVIVGEDQIEAVGRGIIETIYDDETRRVEAQIVTRDGKDRYVDLALIPVRTSANQKNAGVLLSARDVTHRKELERFKARFVADAVHDLATPISALSTRLYTLKRSPERMEEHIRALENQVQHLRDLLGDLRTLSQLDRGRISLSLEDSDLNEVLLLVFDTYEPIAIQKQQSLTLDSDGTLPKLRLDRRQFERVVINLISNAINYTPNGKAIEVKTYLNGKEVVLSVADQGIGISADDLPHVFERFYRTDKARGTVESGTGLGLAIVKEIVELHGGQIEVASELDKGTTFTLRLPVR